MILSFLGTIASMFVLILSVGMIGHMVGSHWRQIAMALNAEITPTPDPIRPVPLVRPQPVQIARHYAGPELRAAA